MQNIRKIINNIAKGLIMSTITSLYYAENSTYQHIQGLMLEKLNYISIELKLNHQEYRLMCVLISLWNKKQNKAYPTVEYLAKYCCMGKATVIKNIESLVNRGLILIVKHKRRNNYCFTNQFFSVKNPAKTEPVNSSACNTVHDKLIEIKPIENKTLDNDMLKNQSIPEHKEILDKLKKWGVQDARSIIKNQDPEKIKKIIEIVETRKPDNAGAYFRSLINMPGVLNPEKINSSSGCSEEPQINKMLKYKYWQHIPSGKILKALPDVGTHILIKYYKTENMVMFPEAGICDVLEHFTLIS
jgi:predicted transcriptional regulator